MKKTHFVLSALLILSTVTFAQKSATYPNYPIGSTGSFSTEIHAAINPTDSNNIIVPYLIIEAGGAFAIFYTKDFGATWHTSSYPMRPDSATGFFQSYGQSPVVTFDNNGTAYVSWTSGNGNSIMNNNGVLSASSTDGGVTWQTGTRPDVVLSTALNPNYPANFHSDCRLSVDYSNSTYSNRLYSVFTQHQSVSGKGTIGIRSKDASQTEFTTNTVYVSDSTFLFAGFPDVKVDPNGVVNVSFFGSKDSVNYALWHASSTDGGASFSTPIKAADVCYGGYTPGVIWDGVTGFTYNFAYPSPFMAINPNNGYIYLTWAAHGISSQATHGTDIYFTRSEDGGVSWTPPIILNDTTDPISDEFHPSIYVDRTGDIVIGWYDQTADPANIFTDYYLAYSTDGGINFNKAKVTTAPTDFTKVGDHNNDFGIGDYTQIISSDGFLIPIWTDGRINDGTIEPYISFIPKSNSIGIHETSTLNNRFNVSAIYPNPVVNELKFDITLKQNTDITIQVINQNGQVVMDGIEKSLVKGVHTITTPIDLAAGNYFLSVRSKEGLAVKKFVVQ